MLESAYKPQAGDTVLYTRPGLKKRVLDIMIPEFPPQKTLVVRGDTRVELVRHNEILLIQSARQREGLPVVAEAMARAKAQWGDEIPPYMKGVPFQKVHRYDFDE
jgi:hypothetical protein